MENHQFDNEATDMMAKENDKGSMLNDEIKSFVKAQVDKATKQSVSQSKELTNSQKKASGKKDEEKNQKTELLKQRKKEIERNGQSRKKGKRMELHFTGKKRKESNPKEARKPNTPAAQYAEFLPLLYNYEKANGAYPVIGTPYMTQCLNRFAQNGYALLSTCYGKRTDLNTTRMLLAELKASNFAYMPVYLKQLYPLDNNLEMKVADISFIVFPYCLNKSNLSFQQCMAQETIQGEWRQWKDFTLFIDGLRRKIPIPQYVWNDTQKTTYYYSQSKGKTLELAPRSWSNLFHFYGEARNKNLWRCQFVFTDKKPFSKQSYVIRRFINGEVCTFNR